MGVTVFKGFSKVDKLNDVTWYLEKSDLEKLKSIASFAEKIESLAAEIKQEAISQAKQAESL